MNYSFQFVPLETENTKVETLKTDTQQSLQIDTKCVTQTIQLDIHQSIKQKLNAFYESKKIPHLIFHGASGSGKYTLVREFINQIYQNDKSKIKSNVMVVNCSHGKGIKFIREELKFFAKTNIQTNSGVLFKTILLLNAHHLTIDAQSALRRCIELFSHNTRFFIIVENKNKLLNPILSRFCEIYVPEYRDNNDAVNLHQHNIYNAYTQHQQHQHRGELDELFNKNVYTHSELADISNHLYDHGISCMELMRWIQTCEKWDSTQISKAMMCYYKIKSEFRNEKLLMFYMLDFVYLSKMEIPNT
jgi:replication-associated recombination protein RarA